MTDTDPDDRNVVLDGGVNGLPSDAFIRCIRRRVLGQGITRDDELVAQVAASCLGGPALEWYEQQSDEVQNSWKLLRRAIIRQWPAARFIASLEPNRQRYYSISLWLRSSLNICIKIYRHL